jgi:hypothetical protein
MSSSSHAERRSDLMIDGLKLTVTGEKLRTLLE